MVKLMFLLPCAFLFGLGGDSTSGFIARQHRFTQHCLFFPGPPYFGLSTQNLHAPQSSRRQAEQLLQRFLFEPKLCQWCSKIDMYLSDNSCMLMHTWFDAACRRWDVDGSSMCFLVLFQCLQCSLWKKNYLLSRVPNCTYDTVYLTFLRACAFLPTRFL